MLGDEQKRKNSVFASLDMNNAAKKRKVRTDRWKYIISDRDVSEKDEFFNIETDSLEQLNLIGEEMADIRILKKKLADHIRECNNLYRKKYSNKRRDKSNYSVKVQKKYIEVMPVLGNIH